jgi:hypothetical protein
VLQCELLNVTYRRNSALYLCLMIITSQGVQIGIAILSPSEWLCRYVDYADIRQVSRHRILNSFFARE